MIKSVCVCVMSGGDFVGTASYIIRPRAPLRWLDPGAFGTLGCGGGFALGAKALKCVITVFCNDEYYVFVCIYVPCLAYYTYLIKKWENHIIMKKRHVCDPLFRLKIFKAIYIYILYILYVPYIVYLYSLD